MAERVVAVTGAAGFIGSHVVRMLRTEGFEVRAVVRPGTKKSQRLAAVQGLGCTVAYADVGDLGALERAFDGCAAVVHLVAIIRERVGATFDLVNRRGAAEVAAAAKVSGVQRIVHLSALGAGPEAPRYLQSKWMGEEAIRRSGVPSVIIRPSFVIVRAAARPSSSPPSYDWDPGTRCICWGSPRGPWSCSRCWPPSCRCSVPGSIVRCRWMSVTCWLSSARHSDATTCWGKSTNWAGPTR